VRGRGGRRKSQRRKSKLRYTILSCFFICPHSILILFHLLSYRSSDTRVQTPLQVQELVKQAKEYYDLESYSKAAELCTSALSIYSDNKETRILRVRANMRLKSEILFDISISKLLIYILTKHHLFFFS